MTQDFSDITFNRNHKQESAAREVASGLRYVIVSFVLNLINVGMTAIALAANSDGASMFVLPVMILAVCAFACGAYGIYSMLDGLGWSDIFGVIVIAMTLIPYAKLVVLIAVVVMALNLIGKAGFRFSVFGPLKQKTPPSLPPA